MRAPQRLGHATALALFVLGVCTSAVRAQTTLDTCGQQVKGHVVLAGDLDCSAAAEPWVSFESPGTLSLNGYTFTGTVVADVAGLTVVGPGTITGPGDGISSQGTYGGHGPHILVTGGASISGNEGSAITAVAVPGNRSSVTVDGATIADNAGGGIYVTTYNACPFLGCEPVGKIRARNASFTGNAGSALNASNITIQDSTISDNDVGVMMPFDYRLRKLRIRDTSIDDNAIAGIDIQVGWTTNVTVVRASLSRNGKAIFDDTRDNRSRIKLSDSVLDGNGYGFQVSSPGARDGVFSAIRCQISQSTFSGISAPAGVSVNLKDTSVTQSGSDAECGVSVACFDLDTGDEPRLTGSSTCATSHQFDSGLPGQSWGLCISD